jgi:hypothetical protein
MTDPRYASYVRSRYQRASEGIAARPASTLPEANATDAARERQSTSTSKSANGATLHSKRGDITSSIAPELAGDLLPTSDAESG